MNESTSRIRGYRGAIAGAAVSAALAMALSISDATAQVSTDMPNGIVASGSSELSLEPQRLRLVLRFQAQGKDAKSAVKALAEHKKRVKNGLVEMNADADSIRFAATRLSSGDQADPEQQQMMQMMQMMQSQVGGASLDTESMPSIYTASSAVQAEWPLPTKDPDALALLPQGLKDQIKNRDLMGKNNKPDLSEEELEQLDEMKSMMEENYRYGMSSGEETSPKIVFVCTPERQQRQQVMKQAFEQAKESAELTAAALGMKLGNLKSAWPTESSVDTSYLASYGYYGNSEEPSFGQSDDSQTITADTSDGLKLSVSVRAVYGFE